MNDTSLMGVATFANTHLTRWHWDGEPSRTRDIALAAVKALSAWVQVDRYTVATATFDEWGARGALRYGHSTPSALDGQPDGLALISAQDGLRLRVAVPHGAKPHAEWMITDPDLRLRHARFSAAEEVGDLATGWLDPQTPVGLGFEVEVSELGQVQVAVRMGLFSHAGRPGDLLVFGVPIADWVAAEQRLEARVRSDLERAGLEAVAEG